MHRGTIIKLVALLAAAAALIFAAIASAAYKPYSLVISPQSPALVAGGETVTLTATIHNENTTQQLGSGDLMAPAGFTVTAASVPAPASATPTSKCSLTDQNGHKQNGPCVALRSLSLPAGATVMVTMTVQTPACVPPGSSWLWLAEFKQANDFSGQPGNDLNLDTGTSSPTTTLDGACSLAFSTEPHNAVINQDITGTDWDSTGPPVAVQVLDTNGNLVSTSTAPVNVALLANPGGAALGGTLTQSASGGTADFGDLTISAPSLGYTLAASSGTLTGTASTRFDIQDQAQACSPNLDCPLTDGTSNHNKSQIIATASTGGGELVESVFTNSADQKALCGAYGSVDPNTYESAYTPAPSSADRGEIITTTFAPTKKLGGNVQQVLKGQQICFGDAKSFVTASGAPATGPTTLPDGKLGFIGLLQTCTGSTVGPCHDRQSDTTVPDAASPTGYDIVLVADVPIGWADDPMHG